MFVLHPFLCVLSFFLFPDDDDNQQVSRVVLRRLSQPTSNDALLGNLDDTKGGRLIIRPKSIQVYT